MNSGERIDVLNVGLMLLSLVLACSLPFELFLFSYAILGPLHYLTEINWLRDRRFFIRQQKWIWAFVVVTVIIGLAEILRTEPLKQYSSGGLGLFARLGHAFRHYLVFWLFLLAVLLVFVRSKKWLIAAVCCAAVAVLVLKYVPFAVVIAAVFLPTIVHVYFFTLLFMLHGSLGNRSLFGYGAVVLLMLIPAWIFWIAPDPQFSGISGYTRDSFAASNFQVLSEHLNRVIDRGAPPTAFDLFSGPALRIQVFIAFCYTYHYLNWFSKTTVIGWHKMLTRRKSMAILAAWALSISLYAYNYRLGFICLSFLSLLHVVLEFPLNVNSIKGLLSLKTWSGRGE